MSKISFPVFTDPRYHAETTIDIDPSQVVQVEEKFAKLFMAGRHRVTQVTLQSGEVVLLRGALASKIENARRRSARNQTSQNIIDGRN